MKTVTRAVLIFTIMINTSLSFIYAQEDGASNPGLKNGLLATVSTSISSDLVQTLWGNGADLRGVANRLLINTLSDEKSTLVSALRSLYEENVEPFAQPTFPRSFRDIDFINAIMLSKGNDSMSFGSRYVYPLHGAVGSKQEALIGWLVVDIYGPIDGPVSVSVSLAEGLDQLY